MAMTAAEVVSTWLSHTRFPVAGREYYEWLQFLANGRSDEEILGQWLDQGLFDVKEGEAPVMMGFKGPLIPSSQPSGQDRLADLPPVGALVLETIRRLAVSSGDRASLPLGTLNQFFENVIFPQEKEIDLAEEVTSLVGRGLLSISEVEGVICLAYELPPDQELPQAVQERIAKGLEITRQGLFRLLEENPVLAIGEFPALAKAMRRIDRAAFVPFEWKLWAYVDMPIVIEPEIPMTTSSPGVITLTLKAVQPQPGEHVLICGAKAGFMASLAGMLVGPRGRVLAVDPHAPIVAHARKAVAQVPEAARVVQVDHREDVTVEPEPDGHWQVVVVNGSVPKIPVELLHQLESETGRMLLFLQEPRESGQSCYLIRKNRDIVKQENFQQIGGFQFNPLFGRYGWDRLELLQSQYNKIMEQRQAGKAERDVSLTGPYPLAKVVMASRNSIEATERHSYMLKAWEVLLKYLTMPALAVFSPGEKRDWGLAEVLTALSTRSSLGHWLNALQRIIPTLHDHRVLGVLHRDLRRQWKDETIVQAFQMLVDELCPDPVPQGSPTLVSFLDLVVRYRNRSGEGHGAVGSPSHLKAFSEALLTALETFILHLQFTDRYELVFLERVENEREGWSAKVRRLRGCQPRVENWDIPESREAASKPCRGVYLAQDHLPVLDLTPWMVFDEGSHGRDLFLFAGSDRYLTYHDQNAREPGWERKYLDAFLARNAVCHPDRVEHSAALETFSAMVRVVVEDGKVTRDERRLLITHLLETGLSKTEAEAAEKVREAVESTYPGIFWEPA